MCATTTTTMTKYELVNKVYNDNLDEINQLIAKSKFQKTFIVLRNFVSKIEDLRRALESLENIQSFYASQCLVRVLNEHFLVAFYIWNRARIENNDDCATDFVDYYPIFEFIKRENFNSKLDKSYDHKKTPLENFFDKVPELKSKITETEFHNINRRANKFDIRIILKFMQDELNNDDAYKPLEKLVLNDCKQYNVTSSYIHGGRLAEKQTFENIPPIDKKKVMRENSETAKIYSYQTLSFILLLLIIENPDFSEKYQPIISFIETK